jgi:hypothetical protein
MATPRCKKRVLELPCHLNCPQGLILQPAAARARAILPATGQKPLFICVFSIMDTTTGLGK